MKNLIVAVAVTTAFLTGAAIAKDIGYLGNKAGGLISFTDEVHFCSSPNRYVFSVGESGQLLEGCWNLSEDERWVIVRWMRWLGRVKPTHEQNLYRFPLHWVTNAESSRTSY
jgi:hypothetical protein